MNDKVVDYVDLLINRYPKLEVCKQDIIKAYETLEECFKNGNKLLVCGNGGSCADAEHIVGELMKGFKLPRKCSQEFKEKLMSIDETLGCNLAENLQGGLSAIALSNHQALNTAFINDVENGGLYTFAQQVYGYGKKGDVLLTISTSGNSKNATNAVVVAKALGMKTIGLSGKTGGKLKDLCDVCIIAPESETYMIQELHLPIYHTLCLMLEYCFYK